MINSSSSTSSNIQRGVGCVPVAIDLKSSTIRESEVGISKLRQLSRYPRE